VVENGRKLFYTKNLSHRSTGLMGNGSKGFLNSSTATLQHGITFLQQHRSTLF